MLVPSSVAPYSFPNCEDHSMTAKAARVTTTQNCEAKDHNLVADAVREEFVNVGAILRETATAPDQRNSTRSAWLALGGDLSSSHGAAGLKDVRLVQTGSLSGWAVR